MNGIQEVSGSIPLISTTKKSANLREIKACGFLLFFSKIQKRNKKECYCILRCTLFLGIKKAPLDLSNGVALHGNFNFFVVTAECERLQTM